MTHHDRPCRWCGEPLTGIDAVAQCCGRIRCQELDHNITPMGRGAVAEACHAAQDEPAEVLADIIEVEKQRARRREYHEFTE